MENQTIQLKNRKRQIEGDVVSDRMQKTVVVEVTRVKQHPKYKKRYQVTKRYKAHDEKREYHIGDRVIIEESNPLSKEKKWTVVKKINTGRKDNDDLIGNRPVA